MFCALQTARGTILSIENSRERNADPQSADPRGGDEQTNEGGASTPNLALPPFSSTLDIKPNSKQYY